MNTRIIAVLLLPAVLAACRHFPPVEPAAAPVATAPAQPAAPAVTPTPPMPPVTPTSTAATVPPEPPIPPSAPVAAAASKATDTTVQVKPPTPSKPAPTPRKAPPPIPAAATAPQPAPDPPALNFTSLERRLRDTRAIGVFTKLSLKNQVDDLLDQFRSFYRGRVSLTFSDLRQRYDLLMLKVISLLQDSDRALASDIVASREAIWSILRDPEKFATI